VFAFKGVFSIVVVRYRYNNYLAGNICGQFDYFSNFPLYLRNILELGSTVNLQSWIQVDFVGSCIGAVHNWISSCDCFVV
jgi:hypothetical protein